MANMYFEELRIKSVREYAYRNARATNIICEFSDVETEDEIAKFVQRLSQKSDMLYFRGGWEEKPAGRRGCDNHVVFEVTLDNNTVIYYFCSDRRIMIGLDVIVKPW